MYAVQFILWTANHLYHPQKPKLGSHFTMSSPAISAMSLCLPKLSRGHNTVQPCRRLICLRIYAIEAMGSVNTSRGCDVERPCRMTTCFGTIALEKLWSSNIHPLKLLSCGMLTSYDSLTLGKLCWRYLPCGWQYGAPFLHVDMFWHSSPREALDPVYASRRRHAPWSPGLLRCSGISAFEKP